MSTRPRADATVLLAIGMVLLAINLRPAATSVGPLIDTIRRDTGLSGTGAGVLATLPVVCFGALAPFVPRLARRLGFQRALSGALAVLVLSLLGRVLPGLAFLFVGTIVAGAAVAVGNVLLPVLVRHSFPGRTGSMTGLYTTALIGFAALAAGVTVPISKALDGGWRAGLVVWAAPAAVALIGWLLMPRDRAGDDDAGSIAAGERLTGARSLTRSTLAWSVTLFFAIQSASFYATLAWLPSIYKSHGASDSKAGLLLSLSILVGVIAAPTVPAIAVRMREQRSLAVVLAVLTAVAWVGILVAPMSAPYLWSVLLGIGENATFPLALTLIVLRGGGVASTAALSTLVQTVGYLLAAVAPLGIGAIHDLSGSWTLPLIVLIALNLPQAVVGLAAGSDRTVSTS